MANLRWTFPAVLGLAQSFPPLPKCPSKIEKSKYGKEKTTLEWSNNWDHWKNFFPAAPICFFIVSKAASPVRRRFWWMRERRKGQLRWASSGLPGWGCWGHGSVHLWYSHVLWTEGDFTFSGFFPREDTREAEKRIIKTILISLTTTHCCSHVECVIEIVYPK